MNSGLLSLRKTNLWFARMVLMCACLMLHGRFALAQTCQSPGLVAWWPAEDNAADVTGWHNGTLVGGVTFAPGIAGSAFNFDGTGGVLLSDLPALDPMTQMTVEAWIKPTPGQGGFPPIMKRFGPNGGYALEMEGDSRMCFYATIYHYGDAGACAGITSGQWSHVAGVYDGQSVTLYVNGQRVAASNAISGTIETSPGSDLGIGVDPYTTRHYTGLIDETALLVRALSSDEIQEIYAAGSAGKCAVFDPSAPPLLAVPVDLTFTGGPSGKLVSFTASAWDSVDGPIPATCSPSTGSMFPLGTTPVSCTATDSRQLSSTATFNVTVVQMMGNFNGPSTITWPPPAEVIVGTVLSAAQLNATVNAPGRLVYDPPAGTVMLYGPQQNLHVTFVPDDPQNYVTAVADQIIDVQWPNVVGDRSAPILIDRIVGGGLSSSIFDDSITPAIDLLHNVAYVPNAADGTVVAVDGETNETTRTISLTSDGVIGVAGAMTLDQVHNRLYVVDHLQPLLWVVDPVAATPVVGTRALPGVNRWIDFNPTTGLLYTIQNDGTVTVVDPLNASAPVSIPVCASGRNSVTINPITNFVYVATGCGPTEILDGDPQRTTTFNTIVGELPTQSGGLMTAVAVSRRTNRVYVLAFDASENHNSVHIFDGNPASSTFHQELTVISLARSGAPAAHDWAMWPTGMGIDNSRGLLYVRASDWQGNDSCDSSLTAVDVASDVVASVTMLPWADQNCSFGGVAANQNTGRIYVTSTNNVTTVLKEIPVMTLATETSPSPVTVTSSQVTVTFAAVTIAGQTTVEQVAPGTLSATVPGGFQIDGGPAFEISTTASISTPIQLCFDASTVTDPAVFATLAVLHGENGVFVDRTVSRDFATATICASVSSLSPFVMARRIGPAYHVQLLYDAARAAASGSTIAVRVNLLDASGRNVSAANVTLKALSMTSAAGGSGIPVNDAGRSNPNGFFRFDPTLGGYIFNLNTRGLKTGSYQLSIEGPDKPLRYVVTVKIR